MFIATFFSLSTILDNDSQCIIASRFWTALRAGDVRATLEDALAVFGCDSVIKLFDATKAALIDGTILLLISHPMERFARETIATLIRTKAGGRDGGAHRVTFAFDV